MQVEIERLTGKSEAAKAAKPKPKATAKPKSAAKAQSPAQRKGFVPRDLSKALITKAKQVWAQYQRDPKAPKVTERSDSWRRGPMLAVAYVWGFTSNADADAKVQAVQTALGKPLTGPNGTMDFASDNPIKRQKCMGTTIAANWQAVADRSGTYYLKPTSRKAKAAVEAIADQGKRTGTKARTTAKPATRKTDPARQNGSVKVMVDKALRDKAKAAERNAQRAANRAKQATQGKAPESAPSAS
jgi:hypothetical protein